MAKNIIQKACGLLRPSYWKSGEMDSGFSLSERIIGASYESDKALNRKLETPAFYKKLLLEIKDKLNEEVKRGKPAEDSIKDYMESLDKKGGRKLDATSLVDTLTNGKFNCASSTSMFLSLAEMLDYDLFKKCYVGTIVSKDESQAHAFIRKKYKKSEFENIDCGNIIAPDSLYVDKFENTIETRPRNAIISEILLVTANELDRRGNNNEAITFYDKSLKEDTNNLYAWINKGATLSDAGRYAEAMECFKRASTINPQSAILKNNIKIVQEEVA